MSMTTVGSATPSDHFNATTSTDRNVSEGHENVMALVMSLNIMSIVINCLAFVLGVLGNGVVIWVTGFKMKKTVNTVWFLNLAVADFLFTAFLPFSAAYTAMNFNWVFGRFMCKFITGLTILNMYVSMFLLVVISVDRCVSVVRPVWAQNNRSVRKASYASLGVWLLSLILSTPSFIFRDIGNPFATANDTNNENTVITCYYKFALPDDYITPQVNRLRQIRHEAINITRFVLGFMVPFTIIVTCYAVIIHRLRRNRTLAGKTSRPFKIIAAVIATFFLCWAPFHIFSLIELVGFMFDEKLIYIFTIGAPIATSLAFLNSCLNPLLYVFMGQDFKNTVRKSILNALEMAFREDMPRSAVDTKTSALSQSNDKTASDSEV